VNCEEKPVDDYNPEYVGGSPLSGPCNGAVSFDGHFHIDRTCVSWNLDFSAGICEVCDVVGQLASDGVLLEGSVRLGLWPTTLYRILGHLCRRASPLVRGACS
jgi:hypothetical protein